MLTYKAELVGIQVILMNESHSTKSSFLLANWQADTAECGNGKWQRKTVARVVVSSTADVIEQTLTTFLPSPRHYMTPNVTATMLASPHILRS
jgi:hypothetical protein